MIINIEKNILKKAISIALMNALTLGAITGIGASTLTVASQSVIQKENGLASRYTTDLVSLARQSSGQPVVFDKQVREIAQSLSRGFNPLIETSSPLVSQMVIESLARRIGEGRVPKGLSNRSLLKLELSSLLTDSKSSDELIKTFRSLLSEVSRAEGILVIEDIHSLIGSSAIHGKELAGILLSDIKKQKIACIGTTSSDYSSEITNDSSISAIFMSHKLDESINESTSTDQLASIEDPENLPAESRIAPDLKRLIEEKGNKGKVNVILQADDVQSEELARLLQSNRARIIRNLENLGMLEVELPVRAVEKLANSQAATYMTPADRELRLLGHVTNTTGYDNVKSFSTRSGMYVNGKYIRIAILDSGIDPTHASMSKTVIGDDKIQYSHDFSGSGSTEDSYGHGTHVATVAAGTAAVSTGAYQGVAYDARLVNLKVLGADGKGKSSGLLNAIDWIAANYFSYKIKVVNLSLGTVAVESYKNDPLCKAVRKLVDLGIVVVAAAGNEGKDANGKKVYGQIHSPGTDPSVITVGASNSMGTASRSDDGVASFSSRGPTRSYWTDSTGVKHYDNIIKPDLVAPGNRIIGARARLNHLVRNFPSIAVNNSSNDTQKMMYMSGTSVAAPAVTGAVALVLNANPNLTPALVKAILMYTAQPLKGFNMFEQGAGQLNVDGAVKLANTVRSDLKGKPAANLVTNPGFESGSLSPWSKDYGSPTVQSTNVKSGSKALKLPYATSIYRTITGLKPNTYYTFTGWFKQTAGDIRVYIENFGGEEYNQAFDNKEYRHLRFEFKTGATNTSVKIVITKAKAGSTSAVGYVDDLELAETSTFPSLPLGNTLLLGTMPAASTTISNFKFAWAQGILLNHAYAIGAELFSKYQSAYDQGGLLGDGQTVSGTSITRNSLKLTTGVTVGNQILTSNGTTLNAGTILVSSGVLLGDGTLLGDGVLLGDGTLLGDGVMLGDGCLLGDTTMSNAVLTQGDGCPCMTP